MTLEFKAWPKIPRDTDEEIVITEKIDGTNACVIVEDGVVVGAQSRKRLITPEQDNMGFARWVEEHKDELASLGDGYHYGEWAGPGIQKNRHKLKQKEFFLFNTHKWDDNPDKPKCCSIVPIQFQAKLPCEETDIQTVEEAIKYVMYLLDLFGSQASYQCVNGKLDGENGKPEGVVVYYRKTDRMVKHTFETPNGKWEPNAHNSV